MKRNPIQPMVVDQHGTLRFKSNKVVEFMEKALADLGRDLNWIHKECKAPNTDWDQFNMLIGYSVANCPIRDELTRFRVDDRADRFRDIEGPKNEK